LEISREAFETGESATVNVPPASCWLFGAMKSQQDAGGTLKSRHCLAAFRVGWLF
jgi:hypothetical protein